jgi:hypothetical protein
VKRAYSLEEVVEAGWAPSVDFLRRRLARGEITGRRVGRVWRMTEDDVNAFAESLRNTASPKPVLVGLSETSSRRRSA